MNSLLSRQLRKAYGLRPGSEPATWRGRLAALVDWVSSAGAPPEVLETARALPGVFEAVSRTYEQYEKELDIKQRSLAQSHAEMMTALKQVEADALVQAQLAEEKRVAEATSQAKHKFLSDVSHEIRTPLNAMLGFTDLLLGRTEDPEARRYLQLMQQAGSSLHKLLSDILDLNKLEQGQLRIEAVPFRLREVLTSDLLPYRFTAEAKGLTFGLDFSPELPEYVLGDPHRIRQIVINLISNALKFTHSGGIVVAFEAAEVLPDACVLRGSVSDTGIGVPPEAQGRLFGRFEQAGGDTSRMYGGSGLGLSICRELAARMGGEVGLVSPLGPEGGSRFWFTVRLSLPEVGQLAVLQAPQPEAGMASFAGLRVLVAEDNAANQILMGAVLGSLGCAVEMAENGAEAVAKLRGHAALGQLPDVVLMDVQMPELDGYAATRALRALGLGLPVVACTANVFRDDLAAIFEAGMDGYLPKPFTRGQLVALLLRVRAAAERGVPLAAIPAVG